MLRTFCLKPDYSNIANRYEDVVMRYQIDGKVRRIISDNASSMKKAFELTLIDMKALEQEAAEMKSDEDLHFSDKGNLQDPEVDLNTLLAVLSKRVSCFAHTMQLCIVHALENMKGKLPGESEDQLSKRLVIHCTNQQPQRGGAVPGPVWVGSEWLLASPRVPVTPSTPLHFFAMLPPERPQKGSSTQLL